MQVKKIVLEGWVPGLLLVLALLAFLYFQNNNIVINRIDLHLGQLPKAFNGYKIIHLSDLHNKNFGKNQKYLVKKIKNEQADIIVFTGDLIDSRRGDGKDAIELMERIQKIAPVYYVSGNHEGRIRYFERLERTLLQEGVTVLRNDCLQLEKDGQYISIIGIDDPAMENGALGDLAVTKERINSAMEGLPAKDSFKILLSHRPEMFSLYSKYGMDIIFTGHAHGGQVRLARIGGLFAPHQGVLPKYTSGYYTRGLSTMIVNRGLGNSIFPQRLFNRPEIVVVELFNG